MASSVYNAQDVIPLCNKHSNKEVSLYCKTCKKRTCAECARLEHHTHDWDTLKSAAKERRVCLPALCRHIRKDKLPGLKTLAKPHVINNNSNKILQQLEEVRTSIIEATNILIDEKRNRLSIQTRDIPQTEIESMLKYMNTLTAALDKNVHQYSDSDVLEMEQQMLSTLEKLESLRLGERNKILIPGNISDTVLNDMIGKVIDQGTLKSVDITETHTIKELFVSAIQVVGRTTAWIGDHDDNKVKLIDNKGITIQTMSYICYGFVVMDSGDHVYTGQKKIRVISPDGSESTICNAAPLMTTWISKTYDEDLLISMRDFGDRYTITATSRRLVQLMTIAGDVKTTYEFHEDGITRLFTCADKAKENRNGDVCIINRTNEESGELIILHRGGRVRYTYKGQSDSAKPFGPWDLACDSKCRILVSDFPNLSVHLLSYDGTFLRYLLRELGGGPFCVSLYDDNLWLSERLHNLKEMKIYTFK